MENDIYWKQNKMYNPKDDKQPAIHVYGCGSIGSHTVMALAKIGFKDIHVYDYDKVEEDNIPAQFFCLMSEGLKTDALYALVKDFTEIDITVHNGKIDEKFEPDTAIDAIHILAFDNMEARKIVYNKLKGYPIHLLDGRIGGWSYEIYYVDCSNSKNPKYERSMEGEFSNDECGLKTLWIVNSTISAKIVSYVLKIVKDADVPSVLKGNMMSEIMIVGE